MSSTRDFDPRTRAFSDEELKPQPMIKKSRKQFVPDEMKDDKYWARRRKNNMAAKRSRDARRMKENQIALRAGFLEKEVSIMNLFASSNIFSLFLLLAYRKFEEHEFASRGGTVETGKYGTSSKIIKIPRCVINSNDDDNDDDEFHWKETHNVNVLCRMLQDLLCYKLAVRNQRKK